MGKEDSKPGPRATISVSAAAKEFIDEWAIERDLTPGQAADLLVGVGNSRLKATTAYAGRPSAKAKKAAKAPKAAKAAKAAKAPKVAAKKVAKPKAAKKAGGRKKKSSPELPAAEATPTLLDAPAGGNPFEDEAEADHAAEAEDEPIRTVEADDDFSE
ncbi:MAG: hypothetical protein M3Z05_21910 [Gemmatimonadota bacterium]|nr:hypothetical protein [Gemmatimonadota bacterium]